MPTTPKTTLDYIRHGEPVGGSGCYRGHGVDDPLAQKGWDQMRATTDVLTGWNRIITSPMQRCRAFAEYLAEQHQLPIGVIENLKEVGFGRWEGLTRQALLTDRAEEYHAFQQNPIANRPEGAEPLADFGQRVGDVFDHLVQQYAGEHLLVVAHAGVIRATFGHVTQAPAINWYRIRVDNASLSRFIVDEKSKKLVFHNWLPSLRN